VSPVECWVRAHKKLATLRTGLQHSHDALVGSTYSAVINDIMKLLDEGLETFEQAALDDIRKNGT